MIVKKQRHQAPRSAFTLMELLVVVAILVMLVSIAAVSYTKYLDQAKRSRALIGAHTVAKFVEAYYINTGEYPPNLEALTTPPPDGGKPYAEASILMDPWGHQYQYQHPGPRHPLTQEPDVYSLGPGGAGGNNVVGNWMEK